MRADRGYAYAQVQHAVVNARGEQALLEDVITNDATEISIVLVGDSWAEDLGATNSVFTCYSPI